MNVHLSPYVTKKLQNISAFLETPRVSQQLHFIIYYIDIIIYRKYWPKTNILVYIAFYFYLHSWDYMTIIHITHKNHLC